MRKIFASILLALAVSSTLFSLPQRETYDSSLWPENPMIFFGIGLQLITFPAGYPYLSRKYSGPVKKGRC